MPRTIAALTLIFVSLSPAAFAQEPPPEPAPMTQPPPEPIIVDDDGPRFRGGTSLQVGALIMPVLTGTSNVNGAVKVTEETFTLGLIGVNGEVGIQINDFVGLYAKPAIDILFGDVGGVQFSGAVIVDFTILDDLLTLGIGPEVGAFIGLGGDSDGVSAAAGAMYGARLHVAWNPLVGDDDPPGRGRKAFTIGLDMRLLAGSVAVAAVSDTEAEASAGVDFFFSPMLTIGYTDF